MNLQQWQQSFLNLSQSNHPKLREYCKVSDTLNERLYCYHNNYTQSVRAHLKHVFLQVKDLLGEDYFNQLCSHFIKQQALTNADINAYANVFRAFLEQQTASRFELKELPYLGDIAKIDYFIYQSYYAKNRTIFNLEQFSQLTLKQQQNCHLCLADDLYYIESVWPLVDLWQFYKNEQALEQITAFNKPALFMIHRKRYQAALKQLSTDESDLIKAISKNKTLENIEQNSQPIIPKWIKSGWISSFKVKQ